MHRHAFQDITNAGLKNIKLTVHKNTYRIKLLRWLFEVCVDFEYSSHTYITSIAILDAYIARACIGLDEYQLTAAASLMIAAKYEERILKSVSDYSLVTDNSCSVEEIIAGERQVLEMLEYSLFFVLPHTYLDKEVLEKYLSGGSLGIFIKGFDCGIAAYLERNPGYKSPFEIFKAGIQVGEELVRGQEPKGTIKFYLNHIKSSSTIRN